MPMPGHTPLSAVVADDEPEIRDLIAEYLITLGYDVAKASDGFEALLLVRDFRPNLLVLDLMMPRLGGIDALGHIRRAYPNVVVVVLTGTPDDALRDRVVRLGAAALLPKPLDLEVLGTIISGVVPGGAGTHPRGEP
jgi:CheY-like chemotaxis protein